MAEINQNYAYNNQAPNYTVPTQAAQYPPRQAQQRPVPPRRVYAQQKPQQPYIPPYYRPQDEGAQESFTERLKEADMMGIVTPFIEHPLAVLGTWLGFGVGLDAYAKACSGPYEKSLPAKAARLGDSIEQSAIVQSKPVKAVLTSIGSGWKKLKKFAYDKSEIVKAMVDTPTQPEWGMTKSQMNTHEQELANEFTRLLHELNLDNENMFGEGHKGFSLGLTKKEEKDLLTKFSKKNLSEIPKDKKSIYTLLKRFKINEDEIDRCLVSGNGVQETKDIILKELGLEAGDLKKFTEDLSKENLNKIKKACEKASGKLWIGGGHYKLLGPLKFLFERKIEASKTYNEFKSIAEKGINSPIKAGAKTATGRFISKAMQITHSGLTWRNGKLGALIFISPMLVEVGQNVIKADKDEKVGTAASGIINAATWILTFPLAVKIMHAFGGIKNLGLTPDKVKLRDQWIKDFNEKAGSSWTDKIANKFDGRKLFECTFSEKAYRTARQELENDIKGLYPKQGLFKKAIRKIAGFLTLDLGNIKGYNGGNAFQKFIGGLPHFLKDLVGIPMRFAVWIFISTFVLDGIISKITAAIFGKPHDAEKDIENKENKKAQKEFLKEDLNNRIIELAKQKQQAMQPVLAQQRPVQRQNMIATKGHAQFEGPLPQVQQPMQEESVDNYTYIPSQKNIIQTSSEKSNNDNYTYIPSQNNTIKTEKPTGNIRHYVPSQRAANIDKTFDNSGLQKALDKADKAEKKALKILGGNFEGM